MVNPILKVDVQRGFGGFSAKTRRRVWWGSLTPRLFLQGLGLFIFSEKVGNFLNETSKKHQLSIEGKTRWQ
jgi:hypothetical protein